MKTIGGETLPSTFLSGVIDNLRDIIEYRVLPPSCPEHVMHKYMLVKCIDIKILLYLTFLWYCVQRHFFQKKIK